MTAPPVSAASPDLLYIGKGILYASIKDDAGNFGPYFDVGNVRELTPALEDTRLDVFSARSASAPLYKSILQNRKATWVATLEEFSKENMRMLLMGTPGTIAAQAATPVVAEVLSLNVAAATLGAALGGKVFHTAKMGPASAIVVDLGATELVLGTDYEIVQNVKGPLAIKIKESSTAVTNGTDDLTIDYTPTAYAAGFNTIAIADDETIEVRLKFVGDPTSGPAMVWDIWKASIDPSGQFGLISEEIAQGQLTFTVLDDTVNHPDSPLGLVTFV